jgi:hypothetical protein
MNNNEKLICSKLKKELYVRPFRRRRKESRESFISRIKIKRLRTNEVEWMPYFIMKAIINRDITGISYIYGYNDSRYKESPVRVIHLVLALIFGLIALISLIIFSLYSPLQNTMNDPDIISATVIEINDCIDQTMNVTVLINNSTVNTNITEYEFTDNINLCSVCNCDINCCDKNSIIIVKETIVWFNITNDTYVFIQLDGDDINIIPNNWNLSGNITITVVIVYLMAVALTFVLVYSSVLFEKCK